MNRPANSHTGLSQTEVERRRELGQLNVVRRETSRTWAGIIRSNLLNVFNLTVFSMAGLLLVLYFIKGDRRTLYDGIAISTVAILNTIISIIQEIRAKLALDRISSLARSTATVLRDGSEQDIPVDEIVLDDVIWLRRGDQVPVDGSVLDSNHCELDESLLTGESRYIYKERGDPVLSGSFCVAGSGLIRAEKVGNEAYITNLTHQASSYKRLLTPLQKNIDRIVEVLVGLAIILGLLVIGEALVDYQSTSDADRLFIETTRSVASIVTSMIPIGLILLSTVAFALGVYRISHRGALVQKLNAIESFANVDVICMDKTGTLTCNSLSLRQIVPLSEPRGESVEQLAAAFAHHSTEKNATISALGMALTSVSCTVSDEIPFNSRERFSALSLSLNGRLRHLFLGAPQTLSEFLAEDDRLRADEVLQTQQGHRSLLLAEHLEPRGGLRADIDAGARLSPLALVVLTDEVRPQIQAVLADFERREIQLKIVSGDAAETIRSVAEQAGWTADTTRVVTGEELDRMDQAELANTVRNCSLFGRVSPENKKQLVQSLQGQGHYVAMVGDGVNDVLALKHAEMGVAMSSGNRMSKDVSDIILLSNDFSVLPGVLDEGNTIIDNIQSAAKLFLTKNVYAVLLILFIGFLGLAFPFVPRHVTLIGFFAISIPALLITFTRRMVDIPPHFLKDVLRFTAISGGIIAVAATLVFFLSTILLGADTETARTALLTEIVLLSLVNFLIIIGGRQMKQNLRQNLLFTLFAGAFAALFFVVLLTVTQVAQLSWLAEFLELRPLPPVAIAGTVGLAAIAGTAMVLVQHLMLRRELAS